jgi:hypothetical protein
VQSVITACATCEYEEEYNDDDDDDDNNNNSNNITDIL